VQSAARLCEADIAAIHRQKGSRYQQVATHGYPEEAKEYILKNIPLAPARGSIVGRTILEGKTVHVSDVLADPQYTLLEFQKRVGYRTALGVPLLREGTPIGMLFLARLEVRPFTDTQIDLVSTFADQAVIAIENTRLFEAEQASKRELQESLEYQTATAKVLSVISSSPNDLQPVIDVIVEIAHDLCEADYTLFRKLENDGFYRVAASKNADPAFLDWLQAHPVVAGDGSTVGLVAAEKRTIHQPDALVDPKFTNFERQQRSRAQTRLGVPLLHEGEVIGVIFLARYVVRPFSGRQIDLVTTFANQAVIAIENTRLFEAEQATKRDLQESLEYQTATSEVLEVISQSKADVQPVLVAIVKSAAKLFAPWSANITMLKDGMLHFVATASSREEDEATLLKQAATVYPIPFDPARAPSARAIVERRIIELADAAEPGAPEYSSKMQAAVGFRSMTFVPLVHADKGIGTIVLTHREPGHRLTDKQRALLQTFADQAVIAIENTRSFEAEQTSKRELQESLEYQTATSEVLDIISRSKFELQPVFDAIVQSGLKLFSGAAVLITLPDGDKLKGAAVAASDPARAEAIMRRLPYPLTGDYMHALAILDRRVVDIPDVASPPIELTIGAQNFLATGYRAVTIMPLMRGDDAIGTLSILRIAPGPLSDKQITLLQTFADQAVIAIENARLFEEVQARTRELAKTIHALEIASQHKSQFVANMSHELRTPLAAVLGYAELMQEGFYGNQSEKSMDALTRIRSNGKHLLGLINTVLDIAKIESGQFTLNMAEYAIESVVETVRSATESLAQNKKLALTTEVAKSLPIGLGDEQRLTQVLLNLVGNAIKFTDTGEVRVTARAFDGNFNVSVSDSGPGIPAEHQTRIFEQFQQVDNSNTRAKGGTGLGLAIARQIVEMHGGRIWVESTLGRGSTFQMELPTRAQFHKRAP
jgi:signal transduction histidine kinase/dihydroneopterin aldolase